MNQIELSPSLVGRIDKLSAKTRQVLARLVHSARLQELESCHNIRNELSTSAPKWVQAEADRIVKAARTFYALRWPDFAEPEPLPRIQHGDLEIGKLRRGWSFHVSGTGYRIQVFETVCNIYFHGEVTPGRTPETSVHGQITQYATKLDAMRAAHWQLCRKVVVSLAGSYERMAKEIGNVVS